jgi:hypothetical protein
MMASRVLVETGGMQGTREQPMEKGIIVAIDHSPQSMEAVRYAAHMAPVIASVRFVLLNIHPTQIIRVLHIQARFQDYCEIDLENETARDAETVLLDDDRHCTENFKQQALTILAKKRFGLGLPVIDVPGWKTARCPIDSALCP